ncbi:glycoside hydrolase family 76 protein [Marinilabilia salmonicolor]|uniref:glycoside hydrolase family 76 protein n=1 Tax=Marinilabilia salmonicolor TaxID=989 RepID=UPI00046AC15B|nr:glycoside hydrolase family 76 protein [Marinilabilia salmonicolor]
MHSIRLNAQPSRSEAKLAADCYNNAYYNNYASGKAFYYHDVYRNDPLSFWTLAEAIETMIDAAVISKDNGLRNAVSDLFYGFVDLHGSNWSNNIYNDDLIWGALMGARAYLMHGDSYMKDIAKFNFDLVWDRGWDNTIDGGIWWTTNRQTKNACVNAPAALTAMFLFYITGESHYKTKAENIISWMNDKLYENGKINGAINRNFVITEGPRTYTQGTYIGACNELFAITDNNSYLSNSIEAMNFTRNQMCNSNGLLPDEYDTFDCQAFKGIFARWACKFVADRGLAGTYGAWLNYNAQQAWDNRNSSGLMWGQWWHRAPDAYLNAWESSSGVAIMNNVHLFNDLKSTGISSMLEKSGDYNIGFSVLPNPANEYFIVDMGMELGNINVMDMSGKIVLTKAEVSGETEVNINRLERGIYFVVMEKHNQVRTEKLIVE